MSFLTRTFGLLRRGLTSTDWLIRAVVAASLALIILAGLTLWVSAGGRAGVQAIDRNGEIAACRSNLNADVVLAKAKVDDVILDGLIAVAAEDDAALTAAVSQITEVRRERDAAITAYGQGTELAERDPDAFLAECRSR